MKGHAFIRVYVQHSHLHFGFFFFFSIHFKHSYSCRPATDLSSPFLPEFDGPGGFSVTDPVNKNKHMYKVASSL